MSPTVISLFDHILLTWMRVSNLAHVFNQENDSMSIKQKTRRGLVLLGTCLGLAAVSANAIAAKKFEPLNEEEFEQKERKETK